MSKLNKKNVSDYLTEIKSTSTVELLEGASKEVNDLIASAKKRGILASGSRDLGLIKTIYAYTNRANSNKDMVLSGEFQKKFPQIVGKPMNINHERQMIVGVYIDYKYILKENKARAYATFFKSVYPELWDKVKSLKKKNKLSSSFEIWSPADKRKTSNGVQILKQIEIAGGALVFEENGIEPAFKDAKVLTVAKKTELDEATKSCMVYASKYKDKEIIVADDYFKQNVEENLRKFNEEAAKRLQQQAASSVICVNCTKEFQTAEQANIKCPGCFAILDIAGTVIYPPQIFNYSIQCPCGVNNWLKLAENDESADLKCQTCSKEYRVTFAKEIKNELLDKTKFLYTGEAICPQCNRTTSVSGDSKMGTIDVKCKHCPLTFKYNRAEINAKKQISQIAEILPEPIEKPKEEEKVEIPKEIEEKVKEEVKKEEIKKAPPVEEKPVEVKEEPKVEVKEEPKVEPKAEEVAKSTKEDISEEMLKTASQQVETEIKDYDPSGVIPTKEVTDYDLMKETENAMAQWKYCTCTKCGYSIAKKAGSPCRIKNCPKCKTALIGSNKKGKAAKSTKTLRKAVGKIIKEKKVNLELTKTYAAALAISKMREQKNIALVSAVKKTASQVISLREEVKKIEKEAEDKVTLYLNNAKTILSRRAELGSEYSESLSDSEILIEDKFERAKLEKENDLLKASKDKESEIIVGTKEALTLSALDKAAKEITEKACGRKKRIS